MSPALAGGFLTTEPPGKPRKDVFVSNAGDWSPQAGREDNRNLEPQEDRLKIILFLVTSDLSDEGILQKPEPFVMELNICTLSLAQEPEKMKEDQGEGKATEEPLLGAWLVRVSK